MTETEKKLLDAAKRGSLYYAGGWHDSHDQHQCRCTGGDPCPRCHRTTHATHAPDRIGLCPVCDLDLICTAIEDTVELVHLIQAEKQQERERQLDALDSAIEDIRYIHHRLRGGGKQEGETP